MGATLSITAHTAANHVQSHPAQDWLRQPHRGRVLRPPARRAELRRAARPAHEDVEQLDEVNADEGVRWLFSFLSADRLWTYCLYEAPSAEAIVEAARRANVPADVVVEVGAAAPELAGRLRDWADAGPSA